MFEDSLHIAKDASACIFYAMAVTVFYKKAFKSELLPSIMTLAYVGAFLDNMYYTTESRVANTLLCIGILSCIILRRNGLVPLKPDVLLFFFVLMDARCNIINQLLPLQVTYWMRILFFAMPQFTRKPIWLKNKLQDVRAMFGPVYIFCVAAFMPEYNVVQYVMKYTAFILALVAGTITRPDNSVILTSFGIDSTFSKRRRYHRDCMMISFACFLMVALIDGYFYIVDPIAHNVVSSCDNCADVAGNTYVKNFNCTGNIGGNHTFTGGIMELVQMK